MAWARPSHSALRARPNPATARATGPGPLRAGRREGVARADLVERERVEAALDVVVRGEGVRVEALAEPDFAEPDFLVEELPDVRLRGGALDRLAMSREYP